MRGRLVYLVIKKPRSPSKWKRRDVVQQTVNIRHGDVDGDSQRRRRLQDLDADSFVMQHDAGGVYYLSISDLKNLTIPKDDAQPSQLRRR